MKVLLAVLVLFVGPVPALAQAPQRCTSRVALGGAASLLPLDIPLDPVLAAGGRHALASSTGSGLEGSINALLPISARWSVTTEFGAGSMKVEVEREADNTPARRATGDDLGLQRFVVGFLGRRSGARSCTYGAIRAGLYRFSYRDVTLTVPGGSVMMGFEAPATGSTAVFFEIEMSVALTEAQPPVTPQGIVVQVRPALGLRYRF